MEISQKNHQGADQTTEKDTDQTIEQYCPVTDLYQRYNLKKAMVYTRLNFLQIKPIKFGVRSFLSQEQLAHMDALDQHIKEKGAMDGYPVPNSNLSGSLEKETAPVPDSSPESTPKSSLTRVNFSAPASLDSPSEQAEFSTEFSQQNLVEELIQEKASNQSNLDIEEVDQDSQQRAAKRLIAGETLTLLYEATENFTQPGLKDAVEAHRARCRAARKTGREGIEDFLNRKISLSRQTIGNSGSAG